MINYTNLEPLQHTPNFMELKMPLIVPLINKLLESKNSQDGERKPGAPRTTSFINLPEDTRKLMFFNLGKGLRGGRKSLKI